ncbi:single-stranded DNA-binding protein [Trujillonella endophytica]|uniref:Single-strand DNA-binding protein n=1 Tax=Trujillonella endophytica TaxID=673521 RepID=A0A1H8R411_9ACTN|nr:single-stranded DNA-binding protein [Trujillella endophytica]SEO61130.1 single-strand DNA-binding protein [Trujillella endophytica]
MPDTDITVVGRVATAPRRARLESGSHVTNFRIASTARRFDRGTQEWVDAETFWSDVECWDELGGNVIRSLSKGDAVVVVGRLWTRDYESANGRGSTSQIRADSVGPDLRHGWADYTRAPRSPRPEAAPAEEAEEFAEPVPFDAPPTDEDYIVDPETLSPVDLDPEVREPALR